MLATLPIQAAPTSSLAQTDARSWGATLATVLDAGAALVVSRETHAGRIIALNGAPSLITLPAAIGDGFEVLLMVTAAAAHVISTADGVNDRLVGSALINDTGDSAAATMDGFPTASNSNTLTCSVAGGLGTIGDTIRLTNYAVDRWSVRAFGQASTDPATPFSNV